MSWPPIDDSIDLSGPWEVTPNEAGAGNSLPAENAEWQAIELPCAWQQVLGEQFHGLAWLRRRVRLPWRWRWRWRRQRFWLRFESVATDCRAWVNGVEVGRHVGDYVPFQLEITQALRRGGSVEILLRVDELHAEPPPDGAPQGGHITKGFHDVISLQHGGVWQPVHLARTGPLCATPDGIRINSNASTGEVQIHIELEDGPCSLRAKARATVTARNVSGFSTAKVRLREGSASDPITCRIKTPMSWRPTKPTLYTAEIELRQGWRTSERHLIRFGLRELGTHEAKIILNHKPVFLSGILDWGHEPNHIAPAPTETVIRARFKQLRSMGINCICLGMWYAPRCFYEIADETGMLIWQVHPVWHSSMQEHQAEAYRRMYRAFMRRDAGHPSVIIVSATCEHPSFDRELASWWWETARVLLPGCLTQVQTACFTWSEPDQTDLYDEHVHENGDRWVAYLEDVQRELDRRPTKPFVMGATALATAWPNLRGLYEQVGTERPWWLPAAYADRCRLEVELAEQCDLTTVARFRRQAGRFQLMQRKFQVERFRSYERHAGLMINHLRDVPASPGGLLDDLHQWRVTADETRPWMGRAALLLATPNHRRAFHGAEQLPCSLSLSNYSRKTLRGTAVVRAQAGNTPPIECDRVELAAEPGQVVSESITVRLPAADVPRWWQLTATLGTLTNWWELWLMPPAELESYQAQAVRMGGLPFTDEEREIDPQQRTYGPRHGLPVSSWRAPLPAWDEIAPELPVWLPGEARADEVQTILTHRLTDEVIDDLQRGGRIILLASSAAGGLGTTHVPFGETVPLVLEQGPLRAGDSEWIVDVLGYDLTRRHCRALPVETLGIADRVEPLVRMLHTSGRHERIVLYDLLFTAQVGAGCLVVSTLDHQDAPGRFLLQRLLAWTCGAQPESSGRLDVEVLRPWAVPSTA